MIQPRCLIVSWAGYLGVAPTLVNMARRFSERGIRVDILVYKDESDWPSPPGLPENVRLVSLDKTKYRGKFALGIEVFKMFISAFKLAFFSRGYQFIVGIDMLGLIASTGAIIVPSAVKSVFVYWSLEITFMRDLGTATRSVRAAKRLEAILSRRVDLLVTQDDARSDLICRENGIKSVPTAFVPNGAMGQSNVDKSSYLHDLLQIESDKRIILYAGMICEEAMSLQLAHAARALPSEYTLVMHERISRSAKEPYLEAIKRAGGGRVRLSLTPVSFDDVDKIFASAHIGIVLYSPASGENYSSVGFASGKLSYLLRNGVPVLVNSVPGLRSVVDASMCGIVLEDLFSMESALREIEASYQAYRKRAYDCFEARFEFRSHFDRAFARWLGET